jgi:hypothetical protein
MMTFMMILLGIIVYLCGAVITGVYWSLLGWPRRIILQWGTEPEVPTIIALIVWPITLILILVVGFRGILK